MVNAVISAVLYALSFAPHSLWWLAPIALTILLWQLRRSTHPIVDVFLFGLISQGIILWWSGKYVGLIPWFLLTILQASFLLPVGAYVARYRSISLVPLIWIVTDEARSFLPFGGFGWSRTAMSQVDAPYNHAVTLGGIALLSLIPVLIAFLSLERRLVSLGAFVLVLVAISLIQNPKPQGEGLRIAAIQGSTPARGLDFNARAFEVLGRHIKQTQQTDLSNIDLVLWPENAIDVDPLTNMQVKRRMDSLMQSIDLPLIAGGVSTDGFHPQNIAIKYSSHGQIDYIYVKERLTPFGEYIPLRSIARKVSPYVDDVDDFVGPKSRQSPLKISSLISTPIICYEIVDDQLMRSRAKSDSAFLVLTNSATFSGTYEPEQQLAITRLRAIEHSREILSVSTVGITAFIDNNGKVMEQLPRDMSASLKTRIKSSKNQTPVDRIGYFSYIFVGGLALLARRAVR